MKKEKVQYTETDLEVVGTCKICGCKVRRKDLTTTPKEEPRKAVYHTSFGVACSRHHGVADHYEELLKKAGEELEGLQNG